MLTNSKKAILAILSVAASASIAFASVAPASFTSYMGLGSRSESVKTLQMFLNGCTDTALNVTAGSAGSPGYETTYYGTKTADAVKAYQAKNSVSTVGRFGPMTRAKANSVGNVCGENPNVPPQSGPVTATLSTNNPAASVLVAGQATANLANFAFTGSGAVTNVTLKRIGVSADSTPANVYLFDGATRLTDAASVSNTGVVTFNNPAGIFTVAGIKNISVKADITSGTSGQTVGIMLTSFTTSGSTAATTANLSGNIHSIASATLASVTHGTVTPSGATINPASAVTLWQSTLSINTRDVMMKRLALRQVGSAPASSFQNFKLFVNGVQAGTASGIDSMGYVTFDLSASPALLVSGSRVVRVDADVVSGASRTVQLSLRNAADVDLVDSSFGVNITPGNAGADPTPWAPSSASTISGASGGTLTIEKDVSSPSTNATLGGSDVNLGTFKVTAFGEPIKIETLKAGQTFTDGGTANAAATLRNGRILINGVQYGSSATLIDAATGTSFTTNFTVYPGTPVMVEVHADIYDNDGTGTLDSSDTILAKLVAGSSNATRVDSLGSFNAPASAVSANTLSIASASATLVKNGTFANQTTVLPATNAKIGSWNLSGSSVEDILLTTLSIDVDEVVSTEFDEGDLTNMYVVVKNAGTIVAQPAPLATVAATDNNFSINYTLAKNASLTIELYANMSDDGSDSAIDAADSFKTDLTVTGTAMVSGTSVNASSGDIDGQTIAYGSASITATADASTPVASIVYDNQTVTSAAFKFAALTSGYNVTDLTLTIGSATVVNNVMLYDGGTLIATKPGASTVTFNGLSWNIPANTNKILTVKLELGTVMDNTSDGTGSTAGASLLTTLTAFTASSTSTGVSAAGTESNPAGSAMYAYAATPTITNVALPSAILGTGTQTVAKFTVASNGGTIGWKKIIFTVTRAMSGTDTLASPTLWDYDTNTQIAGTPTFTGSVEADSDTAGGITFVATNEQQVSGTKTYVLKLVTAFTPTTGDNISVSIAQPSSFAAADDYTAAAATSASFVWSDTTGSGHDAASTTITDWNNDYLVRNLPTDTQTLTVNY